MMKYIPAQNPTTKQWHVLLDDNEHSRAVDGNGFATEEIAQQVATAIYTEVFLQNGEMMTKVDELIRVEVAKQMRTMLEKV